MNRSVTSAIILLLLLAKPLLAQKKGLNVGMGYRGGISQNIEAAKDNPLVDIYSPLFSSSFVGYGVINFRSKDQDRLPVFPYLRVSLSAASRGGVFNIDGTPTKVSFSNIDFDITLPITFRVSNDFDFYFGVGGVSSFLIAQTKDTPEGQTISPGALAEMGISTTRGSYFAFQVLGIYNDYSIQSISMTFGFSIEDAKVSKQRRELWRNQ